MLVKSILIAIILDLTNMKVTQSTALPPSLLAESTRIGQLLTRLRIARKVKQTDAALRSGLSRNTVYRLEKGASQASHWARCYATWKPLLQVARC